MSRYLIFPCLLFKILLVAYQLFLFLLFEDKFLTSNKAMNTVMAFEFPSV